MKRIANSDFKGFVIEFDNRAALVLSAASIDQARELCSQSWFRDELLRYRSLGLPIWDGKAKLSIRCASLLEMTELEIAQAKEVSENEYDEIVFAFLVPLDPETH